MTTTQAGFRVQTTLRVLEPQRDDPPGSDLDAARGCINGIILGLACWAVIVGIWWWVR